MEGIKKLDIFNDLIILIYSINDLQKLREEFLNKIIEIIPYDSAIFDLANTKKPDKWYFFSPVCINIKKKDIDDYFLKYQQVDYTNWIFSQSNMNVYKDTDLINDSIREETTIYEHWLKPMGLYYGCGSIIKKKGILLGSVTLFRKKENKNFNDNELYILGLINKHLSNRFFGLFPKGIIRDDFNERISTNIAHKYNLTDREFEVSKLLLEGLTNTEIGKILFISESTVKKHVSHILDKLEVKGRTQMIKKLLNPNV